ncbi:MAG: hypothetical protein UX64_C0012G0003 [Microgenomates group bacterium GW2011_GWC2_46_7]|nr:MAG: hypothetical protein UX64_C0012G0003 [Microgenomates group bacterium GW2011_GWC2_46_7]
MRNSYKWHLRRCRSSTRVTIRSNVISLTNPIVARKAQSQQTSLKFLRLSWRKMTTHYYAPAYFWASCWTIACPLGSGKEYGNPLFLASYLGTPK